MDADLRAQISKVFDSNRELLACLQSSLSGSRFTHARSTTLVKSLLDKHDSLIHASFFEKARYNELVPVLMKEAMHLTQNNISLLDSWRRSHATFSAEADWARADVSADATCATAPLRNKRNMRK